jgi:hypothetical protein
MRFSEPHPTWQRWRILDLAIAGRCVEILLMLVLPAVVTSQALWTVGHRLTDAAALVLMLGGVGALAFAVVVAHHMPWNASQLPASSHAQPKVSAAT